MTTLKDVHGYLLGKGYKEKDLVMMDKSSVYLANEIMEYAHRNQKRLNGDDYAVHPASVMFKYRKMVGIIDDDPFCIDSELMYEYGIPFEGVQEVALLHDVLEDTEVTMEDIESMYQECDLGRFFELYIKKPLELITHDKSVDYVPYCLKCCKHKTAALVKMLDMIDNLDLSTSSSINDKDIERTLKYLQCIQLINNIYHFSENTHKYKEAFENSK